MADYAGDGEAKVNIITAGHLLETMGLPREILNFTSTELIEALGKIDPGRLNRSKPETTELAQANSTLRTEVLALQQEKAALECQNLELTNSMSLQEAQLSSVSDLLKSNQVLIADLEKRLDENEQCQRIELQDRELEHCKKKIENLRLSNADLQCQKDVNDSRIVVQTKRLGELEVLYKQSKKKVFDLENNITIIKNDNEFLNSKCAQLSAQLQKASVDDTSEKFREANETHKQEIETLKIENAKLIMALMNLNLELEDVKKKLEESESTVATLLQGGGITDDAHGRPLNGNGWGITQY